MKYLKYVEKVQPLWKTIWRFFKKLKTQFPYDPVIPLLGKNSNSKMYLYSLFIAVLLTIARTWTQLKCTSTGNWLKNMWYLYIYTHVWASLVAQTVKNPPAMQETWVQSLGWDDLLEEYGNPLQYSCRDSSIDRGD